LKAYLITDPTYYGTTSHELGRVLDRVLREHNPEYVCFRDKSTSQFKLLAKHFVFTCKSHNISNIIVHSHIELAKELGADGVHLTSLQLNQIPQAKKLNLHVIASTHNDKEIALAQKLGADCITYSPIFETPNKRNPKGLEDLKDKVAKIRTKIIALGGIVTDDHVNAVKKSGAYAFASIRYFIT
jgi:thiamine-phosphate pyrophosphorylase